MEAETDKETTSPLCKVPFIFEPEPNLYKNKVVLLSPINRRTALGKKRKIM
jgi:hypothetical protein